jgi:hypothetical protein
MTTIPTENSVTSPLAQIGQAFDEGYGRFIARREDIWADGADQAAIYIICDELDAQRAKLRGLISRTLVPAETADERPRDFVPAQTIDDLRVLIALARFCLQYPADNRDPGDEYDRFVLHVLGEAERMTGRPN